MKKRASSLKALLLIYIISTLIFLISSTIAETTTITFRGIDWYTTKTETEEQLFSEGASSHGWLGSPNNIYRMSATDYESVTMGSDRVDGGGVRSWYSNIDVAGYDVEDTYACYLYPIVNGNIVRDDDLAELYFGWYSFGTGDYSDHESIFNDLKEKLTSIYGKGKTEKKRYNTTVTWKDKSKNTIRLLINKDNDYVTLGYMACDADKRLDAMKKALTQEAKNQEKIEREKNKTNKKGL